MPATGLIQTVPGPLENPDSGYRSRFDKETEHANLIIDIGHRQGESGEVTDAFAKVVNGSEVEGYVETYPEYAKFCDPDKKVKMYFVARLSKTPSGTGAFVDSVQTAGAIQTKGTGNGLFLNFEMKKDEVLEITTGLGYASIENARLNMKTEATGKSFDDVRRLAKEARNEKLTRIRVEDNDSLNKVKF